MSAEMLVAALEPALQGGNRAPHPHTVFSSQPQTAMNDGHNERDRGIAIPFRFPSSSNGPQSQPQP
ncbi:hypothetical protein NEUTE2DRAFT_131207 [Neurospora tetrasperma FGSC 2509]|nr:hypothetical protein NEUTE2DRAFT_131207 [Neurospora tetrasperma FGSC 2509]